jgi:hypothetical protein
LLTLGIWLGASILADVAVTQNFQAVDRFLSNPSTPAAAAQIDRTGRAAERALLRRNAAEENAWIFINWERAELALGVVLLFLLVAGGRAGKLLPTLCIAMIAMVAAEHFFLTDSINELGRRVDDLPASDPAVRRFWIMHGFYSGLDLLKLAVGFLLAASLTLQKQTSDAPVGPAASPPLPEKTSRPLPEKTGLLTRG